MGLEYNINLIDLNTVSGSTETLRTVVGGYWAVKSSSIGTYFDFEPYGTGISPYVKGVLDNTTLTERVEAHNLLENWKYPIRLVGRGETIYSDVFWKKYLLGGTWANDTMRGIYNDLIYDDISFRYELPYSKMHAKSFTSHAVTKEIECSYQYNSYLPLYKEYAQTVESELYLPNLYVLEAYEDLSTGFAAAMSGFPDSARRFVNRENKVDFWPASVRPGLGTSTSDEVAEYYDSYYFSSSINPLSASTKSDIHNRFQNIIFDDRSERLIFEVNQRAEETISVEETPGIAPPIKPYWIGLLPQYVNIQFPKMATLGEPRFLDAIMGKDESRGSFAPKFMKTLKEVFLSEIDSLLPQEMPIALDQSYYEESSDIVNLIRTANATSVRTIDYLDMLTYAYNNYISTTDNCIYMSERLGGSTMFATEQCFDKTGKYRFANTTQVQGVIRDTTNFVNQTDNLRTKFESLGTVYDFANTLHQKEAEETKHKETLAYRIEKIGGPPTGDARTQNVLQNYWFFAQTDTTGRYGDDNDIKLCDSQVKYGHDYTYNVYAYVAVAGLKYRFSDFRVTRQLGTGPEYNPLLLSRFGIDTSVTGDPTVADLISLIHETLSAAGDYTILDVIQLKNELLDPSALQTKYCLEFYDPVTGEPVTQLLDTSDELATINSFVTNAQITDVNPYLADFYLNFEPIIKIVEVPIYSKTLKILDHPPNGLQIEPYQIFDDSHRIGFSFNYDTKVPKQYPIAITPEDIKYREDYMHANDLRLDSIVDKKSVSRQRFIEVYRMSERPRLYSDFGTHLLDVIDLKIKNSDFTYSTAEFYDRIKPNHKYYYLFRVLNENRTPGYPSQVYEAELIDDGGYTYTNFKVLYPKDLIEDPFVKPIKKFKKLFQLQPNMSHMTLNTTDADFSMPASTQLQDVHIGSAEDLIWDKTFKLRLTSKKTGKKIDLNITYKLNSE